MFARRSMFAFAGAAGAAVVGVVVTNQTEAAPAPFYVINGFYMSMRAKFVTPGTSIYSFDVEWDEKALSWGDFRGKVLGATDPSSAAAGSLRNTIFKDWKALGLASVPNTGDNGVHASASPFEALAERLNWFKANLEKDSYGAAMLKAGIPKTIILAWCDDPQVKGASLFDQLEDIDTTECLEKSMALADVKGTVSRGVKQRAFVFIKPHANNGNVIKLVKDTFKKNGITVKSEKEITAKEIDEGMLIDKHYGAIAAKATMIKPNALNVPAKGQKQFQELFGCSWDDAVKAGKVYNAMDASAKFKMDADELEARGAKAKKAGRMIKFGGGFYCAEIQP